MQNVPEIGKSPRCFFQALDKLTDFFSSLGKPIPVFCFPQEKTMGCAEYRQPRGSTHPRPAAVKRICTKPAGWHIRQRRKPSQSSLVGAQSCCARRSRRRVGFRLLHLAARAPYHADLFLLPFDILRFLVRYSAVSPRLGKRSLATVDSVWVQPGLGKARGSCKLPAR